MSVTVLWTFSLFEEVRAIKLLHLSLTFENQCSNDVKSELTSS